VMGLEKSIAFLATHHDLAAYLIYSDKDGKYGVWESPSLKKIITEAEEEK